MRQRFQLLSFVDRQFQRGTFGRPVRVLDSPRSSSTTGAPKLFH
jgi:hypothetical protein